MKYMTFAENLRELRKKSSLTQESLASEISVSRTLITKYESGAVYPTEENLKRLAIFFDVDIKDLISNDDQTILALKARDSMNATNAIVSIIVLVVSLGLFVVLLIPIFEYGHLITNADGSETLVHGATSLLSAFFKYGNPLAFIAILCAFSNTCLSTASLVLMDSKKAKIIRIINAVVFGITIVLSITTMIYGYQLIRTEDFQMNTINNT